MLSKFSSAVQWNVLAFTRLIGQYMDLALKGTNNLTERLTVYSVTVIA